VRIVRVWAQHGAEVAEIKYVDKEGKTVTKVVIRDFLKEDNR
jgi:hypothetical protein